MKKIRRDQMKTLQGGAMRPRRTLWACTGEEPFTGPVNLCNVTNPQLVCFNTGTCTAIGNCVSVTDQCP